MYVFQMSDGRWRITLRTSSPIQPPVRGLAADLFWNFSADTRAPTEAVATILTKGFGL